MVKRVSGCLGGKKKENIDTHNIRRERSRERNQNVSFYFCQNDAMQKIR